MAEDILGNNTEEAVVKFLDELDSKFNIGPKPISGVDFSGISIVDSLDCDAELAMSLFSRPTEFLYDEMDQVYINIHDPETNEAEKLYLFSDPKIPHFEDMCQQIILKLPEVTYDLECGGYASRQSEAAALYKVAVINKLQDCFYEREIKSILKDYDFSRMRDASGKFAFTELLQKIQEEADSISRVILMCCTSKLVSENVKKDTSYKGILKEADGERLRLLTEESASINFKYNKRYEGATTAREKIEIGEELAKEREAMLNQEYVTSDLIILFSIYELTQNAIPGRAKRRIRSAASEYVLDLQNKGILRDEISALEFKKKLIKRAQKQFLSRMKVIRYKLWSENKRENLIPKY